MAVGDGLDSPTPTVRAGAETEEKGSESATRVLSSTLCISEDEVTVLVNTPPPQNLGRGYCYLIPHHLFVKVRLPVTLPPETWVTPSPPPALRQNNLLWTNIFRSSRNQSFRRTGEADRGTGMPNVHTLN